MHYNSFTFSRWFLHTYICRSISMIGFPRTRDLRFTWVIKESMYLFWASLCLFIIKWQYDNLFKISVRIYLESFCFVSRFFLFQLNEHRHQEYFLWWLNSSLSLTWPWSIICSAHLCDKCSKLTTHKDGGRKKGKKICRNARLLVGSTSDFGWATGAFWPMGRIQH